MNGNKKYYYAENNQQFGPFTFEELKGKRITSETLIWFNGLDEWRKAIDTVELRELFIPVQDPLPSKNVLDPETSKSAQNNFWAAKYIIPVIAILVLAIGLFLIFIKKSDNSSLSTNNLPITILQQSPLSTYDLDNGKFSIDMPSEPDEVYKTVATAVGIIKKRTFTSSTKDADFMVICTDYPSSVIKSVSNKVMMEDIRNSALSDNNCRLLKSESIMSENLKGIAFNGKGEKSGKNIVLFGRYFISDNRLYQIEISSKKDGLTEKRIQIFLDSFKLNKK